MKIKIDFWLSGKASWETEAKSVKDALEIGVKAGVDFSYASLNSARLDHARLNFASLVGASLVGARLVGASLNYASLVGASLDGASLNSARLNYASLVGASLNYANLNSASLVGASLNSASLVGASLNSASLNYASLDGARLDGASLVGASLVGARLVGARFNYARLDGASLVGASLDGAKKLTMPTGETWEEYLTQTVPALLTAGGKTLDEVANPEHWGCHDWTNCPIRAAFGVDSTDKVPPLYRQHAKQFVSLFDAKQIPLERVNPKMAKLETDR
jgi:uncharacterized protein YjbI with pentapeptide repeats